REPGSRVNALLLDGSSGDAAAPGCSSTRACDLAQWRRNFRAFALRCQFAVTVKSPMTLTIGAIDSTDTLLRRHPANPILTNKDWPYRINSVFNAGATLLADGSTLLLCRVEDRRGLSHLCAARSANGVDGW